MTTDTKSGYDFEYDQALFEVQYNATHFDTRMHEEGFRRALAVISRGPITDDDREALAEIVARAIRASRYSGKMVATPQPPEWHNPVDLRAGRRAVDAILASDVWRNRRQEPITDDEREALFQTLWSAFNPGFSEPLEGERDRAYYLAMSDEILAAGFRRQEPRAVGPQRTPEEQLLWDIFTGGEHPEPTEQEKER